MNEEGLICNYCGENTGMWYGQLSKHLWIKHPNIMIKTLKNHCKPKQQENPKKLGKLYTITSEAEEIVKTTHNKFWPQIQEEIKKHKQKKQKK